MPSAAARDEIVEQLEKGLLGPRDGKDESFVELPTQRYIVGVLYPRDASPTREEEAEVEPEGEADDEAAVRTVRPSTGTLRRPSVMGLSFLVEEDVRELEARVKWATYSQAEKRGAFQRHEHAHSLRIDPKALGRDWGKPIGDSKGKEQHRFMLRGEAYQGPPGTRHVTLFLVNEELLPELDSDTGYPDKAELAKRCIYGPALEIVSEQQGFTAMTDLVLDADDEDFKTLRLLYRHRREFAVGHGCAAEWDAVKGERCGRVRSTFLPRFRQPSVDFTVEGMQDVRMVELSEPHRRDESLSLLAGLVDRYEKWTASTFGAKARASLEGDMAATFDRHRKRCEEAVRRMREGISLLKRDDTAFEAFCFMNEAMFLQKAYGDAVRARWESGAFADPDVTDPSVRGRHRWRPFQIAFILMCLPGLDDPTREDRDLVDLLWVQTGAGKTEAYLGLAVLAMVMRRLKRGVDDPVACAGVSVLLRYTLRLLTIQQFQRAAGLMCACEHIRLRRVDRYGTDPFAVGLFIGESTTPNRSGSPNDYDDVAADRHGHPGADSTTWYALEYWRREGERPKSANPFQLTHCPWCGEELTVGAYDVVGVEGGYRLRVRCPRADCFFHRRADIPIATVDDEIFGRLPPFVIATVDKFAMLPFRPQVACLFGHVVRFCPLHGFQTEIPGHPTRHNGPEGRVDVRDVPGLLPPDLIIQDELHLINGPLGSLVGMYESTIHYLCERRGWGPVVRPKIIASTATVRRAPDQVWSLYRRDVRPFPPPGLEFEDSFFVHEVADPDARMYMGLFPSGIALATAFVRTSASLLESGAQFKSSKSAVQDWDDYWSVVTYFNSIRELGSSKTRIEDDIQRRVAPARGELRVQELTSRVDSKDLPEILAKLAVPGSEMGAIDVLACSNMFSVGVDVQRLGVMVMNGQPKSAAEYIQATGRVGRRNSGLVIVLFNWARARDQSHFERFNDFHRRIHLHVESLTVTPFSEGVRARALHAQYVAGARVLVPGVAANTEAGKFDTRVRTSAALRTFMEWLCKRPGDGTDESAAVSAELQEFIDRWVADAAAGLRYAKLSGWERGERYLMRRIDDDLDEEDGGPLIVTPTSMRNIEREVSMHELRLREVPRTGRTTR